MRSRTDSGSGPLYRTLLITDIVRSTEHVARLGDARWRELIERLGETVEQRVGQARGTIVSDRGDGFLIAFETTVPALQCAEQLCLATADLGLELRAGLHAGECELLGQQLAGMAVHIAARISELAGPSEVLVSSVVRDLMRGSPVGFSERGVQQLRGVPRPWRVYALESEDLTRAHAGVEPAPPDSFTLPLPPVAAARLRESRLAGRTQEVRRGLAAGQRVQAGEQRLLLIAGEPGIGKSRLSAELAGELHGSGMTVLWGRCDPELGVPYQPFVEILTHYARFAAPDVLAQHRARYGNELARLVPELSGSVATTPVTTEGSRQANRHVMFAAVAGLLHTAAVKRALVLVLEDLHWADMPTLLLLKYLQLSAEPMRALLIGTYRSTERTPHQVLDVRLTDLHREQGVELISLGGLPADEVVTMAEDLAEERLEPDGIELVRGVWKQTHGNPFFVGEIVRSLREAGGISQAARNRVRGESLALTVPYSIRETIADRVARMGVPAEQVLSSASVIGAEFDVELLAQICEVDQEPLVEVLDAATRAALITEVPGIGMRFSFVHQLIARALYQELGGGRRRLLHVRALDGLEQLLGDEARRQRILELAHHALQAVPMIPVARSVDYARQAGEHALGQLAPQEALRWFGHALDLHERLGADATDGERRRLHCDLLTGRGIAQQQSGDPQFRDTLLEAGRLARELSDSERLVRATLANTRGFVSETGRVDDERVEMLEAALATVGEGDSSGRARLLSVLSGELTFSGDWRRRKALSDEALAIARRLGEPATLIAVLNGRFITIWTPETLDERRSDTELGLTIAEELGDSLALLQAIHWKAAAAVEAGELDLARQLVERQTKLSDRLRQPTLGWLAAYDRTTQALMQGLLEEAERSAEDARQVALESEQPEAIAFYAGQLINIRFEQGRLDELEPLIAQQAQANPGIPAFRAALALARSEAGMREEALEVLAIDAANDFADMPYDSNWLAGMAIYAQACTSLEDPDAASRLYRRLEPWRRHVAFNSATTWGLVERHLGNLERILGRYDEAEASLISAARRNEAMGTPIWLARTRLDLARLVLERGGDPARAADLLELAAATARDLGCRSIKRQAAGLLEQAREPA
jgi:class 3 adenylate cyclase/tetratricopeptide (TPR) repeat protein